MSLKPIVLYTPKPTLTSDEACTTIHKYQLAPAPSAARTPYQSEPHTVNITTSPSLTFVPSLAYFCIKAIVEYPEQLYTLGPQRVLYTPPNDGHDFDIIQALIPSYRPFSSEDVQDLDLRRVDPRLWAVLVQIFNELPETFREYTLPLSDVHMPLLQMIPSTQYFSLVTVLTLSGCDELTDDNAVKLRHLHLLAALDASATALGSYGIQRLAKSLSWSDGGEDQCPERRGPWGLRVLFVRNCMNIDDEVLRWLPHFPLLSVVDLRGTLCKPRTLHKLPFQPSGNSCLFHPSKLSDVLDRLASDNPDISLFSQDKPFLLNVDSLQHKQDAIPIQRAIWDWQGTDVHRLPGQEQRPLVGRQDVFLPQEYPRPTPSNSRGIRDQPAHALDTLTMLNNVAAREQDEYAQDRLAAAFYSRPPIRGRGLDRPGLERTNHSAIHRRDTSGQLGPKKPNNTPLPQTSTIRAPDLYMLCRTPPPWSCLPSSPPLPKSTSKMPRSVFDTEAASLESTTTPSLKRKDSAESVQGKQARKRMYALSSIQRMFSLVQKRADAPPAQVDTGPSMSRTNVAPASANPFARSVQAAKPMNKSKASSLKKPTDSISFPSDPIHSPAPVEQSSHPTLPHVQTPRSVASNSAPEPKHHPPATAASKPTTASTNAKGDVAPPKLSATASKPAARAPAEGTASTTAPEPGPSAKPAAPSKRPAPIEDEEAQSKPLRPAKKYRPISSLPVPPWPTNGYKPITAHKLKPAVLAKVQTTLPASLKKADRTERRVSAPAAIAKPLEMVSVGLSEKKGKDPVHPRTSEKGGTMGKRGFDWKGWSSARTDLG